MWFLKELLSTSSMSPIYLLMSRWTQCMYSRIKCIDIQLWILQYIHVVTFHIYFLVLVIILFFYFYFSRCQPLKPSWSQINIWSGQWTISGLCGEDKSNKKQLQIYKSTINVDIPTAMTKRNSHKQQYYYICRIKH